MRLLIASIICLITWSASAYTYGCDYEAVAEAQQNEYDSIMLARTLKGKLQLEGRTPESAKRWLGVMLGNLDKWLETTKTSISENAKRDEKDLLSTMEKIHKETLSAIYWYSSIPKDLNAKLEKEVSYMVGSIRGAEYAHLVPEMEEEYYEAHREAYYALKKLAALADIAEDVTSISETGMYLLAKESFEGIKASISKYFEVSTNISLLGAEATHKKMSDELAKFDISTGDHHAMEILRTRELENAKKLREFINSCANPSSH